MPERGTHSETLQAGARLTVGTRVLLPIERVVKHVDIGDTGLWFSFEKEPYALVICDAGGARAVSVAAAAVSLEDLRARIPDFDSLLAPC